MSDKKLRLLIVEDDRALRSDIRRRLKAIGLDTSCDIREASDSREAITVSDQFRPNAVLLDLKIDPGDDHNVGPDDVLEEKLGGLRVLNHLKRSDYKPEVLIITVIQDQVTMKAVADAGGTARYLGKPVNEQKLLWLLNPLLDRLNIVPARSASQVVTPGLEKLHESILRVAPTKATVLIRGPSGSGKEIIAHLIVCHSGDRKNRMLEVINCAAIPSHLIESELFGHEKGAFTGADSKRVGKFEQVDGGTLFLDEIGELPLKQQGTLLRVLESGQIQPVGGKNKKVDVRVIAATNRNLEQAVRDGKFREDLLFRFREFVVSVPPLADRIGDLEWLVPACLEQIRDNRCVPSYSISKEAIHKLKTHNWPGNVRELKNVLVRAAIEAAGKPIEEQHISFDDIRRETDPELGEGLSIHATLEQNRERLEQNQIRALRARGLSTKAILEKMGISRSTLWRKEGEEEA